MAKRKMIPMHLYFNKPETDVKVFKFSMETKFRKNDIVYERINPFRKMVVKHFTNGLYYCHFPESVKRLFVYPERELMSYPLLENNLKIK